MGGARGNALLTSLAAAVLLVLLALEGATIPQIQQLLSLHVFVGLLLLGPVALKLASTGWRFARYYRGSQEYVEKGPPLLALRLLAPLVASTGYRFVRYYGGNEGYVTLGPPASLMRFVVAPTLVLSTLVLFGTGVALLARPTRGTVLTLHKASFVVWFGAMTVHVLGYAARVGRQLVTDAKLHVDGRGYRVAVTLLAIVAGVVTAFAAYSLADPWLHGLVR
jgi:hypothetical protein